MKKKMYVDIHKFIVIALMQIEKAYQLAKDFISNDKTLIEDLQEIKKQLMSIKKKHFFTGE